MATELVACASRAVLLLLIPAAVAGWALGGWRGALGAASGALLSLTSLHWIARGLRGAAGFFAGGRAHPLWIIALGLRYVLLFGAVALLLGSGAVHPLALMGGLSILPPVLVVLGLRAGRAAS
jgi:hypothetical protein